MTSKWAESDTPNFKCREDAVMFCQTVLDKQLLVGGKKIEMQKTKKEEEEEEDTDSKKVWTTPTQSLATPSPHPLCNIYNNYK